MSDDRRKPAAQEVVELDLFGDPTSDQKVDGEDSEPQDDAPETPDNLFSFARSEQAVVQEVNGIVRGLLKRPDLRPREIAALATFLFGLERLPRATPGLNVVLTLTFRFNQECSYRTISLSDDSFSLESGGTVYDPAVGGDNYGSTTFEVGVGWRGDVSDWCELSGWMDSFRECAESPEYDLEIDDYGDEEINWDIANEEDPDDAWRLLPDDGEAD